MIWLLTGFLLNEWQEERLNNGLPNPWRILFLLVNESNAFLVSYVSPLGRFAKLNIPSAINFKIFMKRFSNPQCLQQTLRNSEFSKFSPGNPLCMDECQASLFLPIVFTPLLESTVPQAHTSAPECKHNGAQGSHSKLNLSVPFRWNRPHLSHLPWTI